LYGILSLTERQSEPFKDKKKMENMKTYESGSTSKRFPIFEMGSLYSEAGKLKTLKTEFLKAIRKSQKL